MNEFSAGVLPQPSAAPGKPDTDEANMIKPQTLLEVGSRELRLVNPATGSDLERRARPGAFPAALTLLRVATVLAAVAALASLSAPPA